jgi:hypothetical protein
MIISTQAQCLLLMPRSVGNTPILPAILETLRNSDIEPVIPELTGPSNTFSIDSPRYADLIIADVTGSDPNIMFELGYSLAIGKPILPIVNRSARSVPPVLAGYFFLVYNPDQPDHFQFREALQRWVVQNARARRGY